MPRSTLIRSVGLTSSTSGDGVEAALIDTDGRDEIIPLGGLFLPYDSEFRWQILEATQSDLPLTDFLRLESRLTQHHISAFELLKDKYSDEMVKAEVLGFQGHTLRHIPSKGLTLQIGNAWQLTESTKLPVVSDFQRHDMAIGGQGGPLVAMFHWALMAQEPRPALMLNLDSVASVTWLSKKNDIIAGDTGPGVGLLNEWVQEMAELPHDLEGRVAIEGKAVARVVRQALKSKFFSRNLPKSADRYEFDHIDLAGLSVPDGAATLCAITVEAFACAVKQLPDLPDLLWVTGPGSQHPVINKLLSKHFSAVKNVSERGLDPHTMAAECFAWLAVRHTKGLPITTPETTGCRSADCAGWMTLPTKE
ncbi:anhydro-N-acetylmuramic acid kinase [Bythopirellula goksoeyrii]|uniref:Anhydro-N-acetylmuramic acid kinase n=1 Tax=Bythopirellula goksoeyrii TaxID=1400387 RepID=A0A5B9QF04_9BACT|nr:anhydro-N-acetylmuramic acid kinase [Bythopirellula goksoeyrii]QEG32903.1 Anhydro-N-acetylmuramic acid kinase [Bythopirellula goksoeyrii]